MLKIPIVLMTSLAIFIIILTAFYMIFGRPECDSYANQTAYSLKLAIDEVSKDYFKTWTLDGVPPDNEPSYYKTASIRLCQERGTSFWESFFGTPPEYQIYYETFPEGGWLWNEAYPWSGGAAGTIKFWGALRIGTGIWKLSSTYLTRVGIIKSFLEKAKGKLVGLKSKIFKSELQEVLEKEATEYGIDIGVKRPGEILAELHKCYEADEVWKTMKEFGFVTEEVDEVTGKIRRLIISDEKITLTIPLRTVKDGEVFIEDRILYVKRKVDGTIEDMSTELKAGFEEFRVSPAEVYKDYLETIPEEKKKFLEDMFTVAPTGIIKKVVDLPNKIKDTTWYKSNFQPIVDRIKKYIKKLGTIGYDVDVTSILEEERIGIVRGTKKLLEEDEWYQKIIKDETFLEKVKVTFGLASIEDVTKTHIYKYTDLIQERLRGYIFIPKEMKWRINQIGMNIFEKALDEGVELTMEELENKIVEFATDEAPELINTFGEGSEATFRIIIDDILQNEFWVSGAINNYVASGDKISFVSDLFVSHMKQAGLDMGGVTDEIKEAGWREFGLMIGTIEQNKNTLPMTFKAAVAEGFEKKFKRIIYLDGSAIFNPGSWYAQEFLASRSLARCEGNSVCILSKNVLETPFYLNETANKYFIRVWRPVEAWKQWAGLQAALMHVPEHPRFYVVSPCFATAKVWKTIYKGEPTIFILPEKADLGDSASNYCYADTNLVNQYTAVWAISDFLDFMPWTRFLKTIGLAEKAAEAVGKTIGIADPVTLIQGIVEGAISWPGYPWTSLTIEEMQKFAGNVTIKELQR